MSQQKTNISWIYADGVSPAELLLHLLHVIRYPLLQLQQKRRTRERQELHPLPTAAPPLVSLTCVPPVQISLPTVQSLRENPIRGRKSPPPTSPSLLPVPQREYPPCGKKSPMLPPLSPVPQKEDPSRAKRSPRCCRRRAAAEGIPPLRAEVAPVAVVVTGAAQGRLPPAGEVADAAAEGRLPLREKNSPPPTLPPKLPMPQREYPP